MALVAPAGDRACVALVAAAHEAGVPVTAVPGPSLVTIALAVSGLPCDRFRVEGFPPHQAAARRSWLEALATEPRTMVVSEEPHRVAGTLADLAAVFGQDRPTALCQQGDRVRRDRLGGLAEWTVDVEPRGEVTLPAPRRGRRGSTASASATCTS